MAIDRSLASRVERHDGARLVMRSRCADACSLITGRGWALNGSRAV
jgi:hypothetical protein